MARDPKDDLIAVADPGGYGMKLIERTTELWTLAIQATLQELVEAVKANSYSRMNVAHAKLAQVADCMRSFYLGSLEGGIRDEEDAKLVIEAAKQVVSLLSDKLGRLTKSPGNSTEATKRYLDDLDAGKESLSVTGPGNRTLN